MEILLIIKVTDFKKYGFGFFGLLYNFRFRIEGFWWYSNYIKNIVQRF